jgi:hypothetical protein
MSTIRPVAVPSRRTAAEMSIPSRSGLAQRCLAGAVVAHHTDQGHRQAQLRQRHRLVGALAAKHFPPRTHRRGISRPGHLVYHQHQVPGNLAHHHDCGHAASFPAPRSRCSCPGQCSGPGLGHAEPPANPAAHPVIGPAWQHAGARQAFG